MIRVSLLLAGLWQSPAIDEGRRFLEDRDFESAERSFRQALAENAGDSRAHYYLGVTLSRQGRVEEAITVLSRARTLSNRPNPSLLFELGTVLSRAKRWNEAEAALKQATELAPNEAGMRLQLGWVYYSKLEGEKAKAEFERVLASAPTALAWLYLGLTEVGLGENDTAVGSFGKAIQLDPSLLEAHIALGKILNRAGRSEEARSVLLRALELEPRAAEAHFQLGLIALRAGESELALQRFEAAIDCDDEHLDAWYNRALVSARLGRPDEAEKAFQRVAELRASGAGEPDPMRRTRTRAR